MKTTLFERLRARYGHEEGAGCWCTPQACRLTQNCTGHIHMDCGRSGPDLIVCDTCREDASQ